jgi:nucleotide-binding universal stress UspA family protein
MKLDPGSSHEHPSVTKTSTPAIYWVMIEVTLFTALLGPGMHALNGLQADHGEVNAPGHPGVRDQMLRYMAEVFIGQQFGPAVGNITGLIVATAFVREQPTLNLEDFKREWTDDRQAQLIFKYAKEKAGDHPVLPCYAVSDPVAITIVEITATARASHLILGASRRNTLASFIRGNLIRRVSSALPKAIDIVVYIRQGE